MTTVPSHAELERIIASVPGIESAAVGVTSDTGRGRLRVRLAPGEDPRAVSWAVATTLRERFGIALDPDAIRPRPRGAAASSGGACDDGTPATRPRGRDGGTDAAPRSPSRVRASIEDLATHRSVNELLVTATLSLQGRRAQAAVEALPTRQGRWRAVAEATLGALRELTGPAPLRAAVEQVAVASDQVPAYATVVVSVLGDHGEESLLGASLLRDDPERAVMRATLDALNRKVEPLLRRVVTGAG